MSTVVGPITRTTIARYAGAGGDFNPIHVDEEFAQAAGMPSVFAHGLLSAGLLGQYLAQRVGAENVLTFGVRFTGQVWPGDELTIDHEIEHVEDGVTHFALVVTRQTGDVVLTGTATARVGQSVSSPRGK